MLLRTPGVPPVGVVVVTLKHLLQEAGELFISTLSLPVAGEVRFILSCIQGGSTSPLLPSSHVKCRVGVLSFGSCLLVSEIWNGGSSVPQLPELAQTREEIGRAHV